MGVGDGAQFARLKAQLAAEREARAAEQARAQAQIDQLTRVNDALGKAIGLLQQTREQQEPENSAPKRSRTRRPRAGGG